LILIDVGRLATMRHPTAGAIRCSRGSSEAGVYTRASVRRASGFVLTGKQEVGRSRRADRYWQTL